MRDAQLDSLAARVEEIVVALPGVSAMYRDDSLGHKVIELSKTLLLPETTAPGLVSLELGEAGYEVRFGIGVIAGSSATETAHRSGEAVMGFLQTQLSQPVSVAITVLRVEAAIVKRDQEQRV